MSTDIQAAPERRRRKARSDAVENREGVLVAAREVFAESGMQALIPGIAARAGVGMAQYTDIFPVREPSSTRFLRNIGVTSTS